MRKSFWFSTLALGGLLFMSVSHAGEESIKYPATKRTDFTEVLHGVKVPDPYRWLEQDVRASKEVKEWVEEENKVTNRYLESIPERKQIQKRLTELWNYEKYSAPFKAGSRYFFTKNDGLQNQSVLYWQAALEAPAKVLIDPNTWSKDGTIALSGLSVSDDGKLLAYGKSEAGSDWSKWYVMDVATGKVMTDELRWVKFTSADWTPDNQGFFHTRFPEPEKGKEFQGLAFNAKLCYHKVGTPQTDDAIIYERPDHKEWGFNSDVSEDGNYLIIYTWKGTDRRYRITYKNLKERDAKPIDLIDTFENAYTFLGNNGTTFFFKTDNDAPRSRIIAIDITKPAKENWKEILPQAKDNMVGAHVVGEMFVCNFLKDASTQVKMFKLDGTPIREVKFPTIGTAGGFGGKRKEFETFYTFTSFTTPPTIYSYNLKDGESKIFRQPKVPFDPSNYEVKQVFYKSKDGTKVPMFLSYKKGMKLTGNNPTLLYGYGGFNIPLTPNFSITKLAWMEMGGVYAQASIRGGGEYGKDWHQAAVKLNRQKAYDDFIAAAEYLIAKKYTQSKRLAIQGGSNGGLLVGAVMTQRPELFGATLPAVGVMDMLRFHKFTAGRYWVDDYGSPDDPEQFQVLLKYSPYHNLKKGVSYPATLVTTADTDDRVVPSHSFKFIAKLQYCQAGPAPVLARIETRAGHGAGRPTSKIIEEAADQFAFLVRNLHMKLAK